LGRHIVPWLALVFLTPQSTLQWALPGLAVALYWAAFHGRIVNAFFRNPVIVYTGGACYSIYLLHFSVIAFATRLAGHQRTLLFWLLSLILIPAVSVVFFLLIEKPCMNPNWPRDLVNFFKGRDDNRTAA
jgi:peptidoglycan/LPS O-acetylase OafA/YrhL